MGQKMKSAPVYFAIAQARYNPVSLGPYTEDIRDRMRKAGYPDYNKAMSLSFNLTPQSGEGQQLPQPRVEQVERLMFSNSENSKGFIVEQNALSFQTTEYDVMETFIDDFSKGLSIVHECVTLAYSERIGLRYLNAIVPHSEDAGLADYLVPGVLGLKLPDTVEVPHSFTETHIRTPDCLVLARIIIRNGLLGFPMDLQPMGVKVAERFQSIHGVHAILDTDASVEERHHPFDIEGIKEQLKTLRKGIGIAFDAVVTPPAIAKWNK